jgi:hypothetical protein
MRSTRLRNLSLSAYVSVSAAHCSLCMNPFGYSDPDDGVCESVDDIVVPPIEYRGLSYKNLSDHKRLMQYLSRQFKLADSVSCMQDRSTIQHELPLYITVTANITATVTANSYC